MEWPNEIFHNKQFCIRTFWMVPIRTKYDMLQKFEVSAIWRYNLQKKIQKSVRYNQVSAIEVAAI